MSATLPTNWLPNHTPTAAELAQVLNAITRITNIGVMSAIGTASISASGSASYVDITGTSLSWSKSADSSGSDILVLVAMSGFPNTSASTFTVGINIGGTDYDVINFQPNPASTRSWFVGFRAITGVGVGSYTPKLRLKRTAGTGTLTLDTNDNASFVIGELPK